MRALPLLLCVACAVPPEAPSDLDELTHYLFREWDNEDPRVVEAGLINLQAFFADRDVSAEVAVLDRSWELTSVTEADLASVDLPEGRDPADTYGVSVARLSTWPVTDHATWQLQVDQSPAEPSASGYVRNFLEPGIVDCFPSPDCPVLNTLNEISRSNALMSVSYTMPKDIQLVELGDSGTAMHGRAWIPESAPGDLGRSTIWQSYSMDIWLPHPDASLRYQVLWSEANVAGASDAIQVGTVKVSTDNHFRATDEAIAASRERPSPGATA